MGYLENNLTVMEKMRPLLFEKIKEKREEEKYSCEHFECVETRDGNLSLCITKDNKVHRLNSVYRPIQEAQKWVGQYNFIDMNVTVIMYGLGSGIFLKEILKCLDTDGNVFVYEPDLSLFLFCIENFEMEDILKDERVQLFVEDINLDEFGTSLDSTVHWTNVTSQIICNHPMIDKLYMEGYVDFLSQIESVNNLAKVNRDTESMLAQTAVSNIVKNFHFIKDSNYVVDFIEDIPANVPAIIVAAGPSLDKNIDELKKAEGKAFIFATDTAVKYLLAHDIKFDAMITLDAKKSISHMMDERCMGGPLFCNPEARNEILEMNQGRKIWFRGNSFLTTVYNEMGRFFPPYSSGGSVATGAFGTCVSLGFNRIVLIGQDLAYDGDVTHAGGSQKHIMNEEYGAEMVDGVNGEKVKSRYDWLIYKDWFEESIKVLPDIDVIDATEGGALIKGSKVMKLSEVIEEYCIGTFDFEKILSQKKPTFNAEEYEKVKDILFHLEKEFVGIQQKARDGKSAQEALIKMIHSGKTSEQKEEKYLKVIRKTNNFISKQKANELLDSYATGSITEKMQGINSMTNDADENMIQTLEISKVVYEAMIDAVNDLTPVLKESLAKL